MVKNIKIVVDISVFNILSKKKDKEDWTWEQMLLSTIEGHDQQRLKK